MKNPEKMEKTEKWEKSEKWEKWTAYPQKNKNAITSFASHINVQ